MKKMKELTKELMRAIEINAALQCGYRRKM